MIFHYKEDFIEALARISSSLSCVALDLFQAGTMRSVIVFFALVTGASAFQARSPSARRSVTKEEEVMIKTVGWHQIYLG